MAYRNYRGLCQRGLMSGDMIFFQSDNNSTFRKDLILQNNTIKLGFDKKGLMSKDGMCQRGLCLGGLCRGHHISHIKGTWHDWGSKRETEEEAASSCERYFDDFFPSLLNFFSVMSFPVLELAKAKSYVGGITMSDRINRQYIERKVKWSTYVYPKSSWWSIVLHLISGALNLLDLLTHLVPTVIGTL